MKKQMGLQSRHLLASLWDFNRKDGAAVRRLRARSALWPAQQPPQRPAPAQRWRHFSGVSLCGLSTEWLPEAQGTGSDLSFA